MRPENIRPTFDLCRQPELCSNHATVPPHLMPSHPYTFVLRFGFCGLRPCVSLESFHEPLTQPSLSNRNSRPLRELVLNGTDSPKRPLLQPGRFSRTGCRRQLPFYLAHRTANVTGWPNSGHTGSVLLLPKRCKPVVLTTYCSSSFRSVLQQFKLSVRSKK